VRADIEYMRTCATQLSATFAPLEAFMTTFDNAMKREIRILRAKENSVKQADISLMSVFVFSSMDNDDVVLQDEDDDDDAAAADITAFDSPMQLPAAKRTKPDLMSFSFTSIEPKPVVAADLAPSKPGSPLFELAKLPAAPSPVVAPVVHPPPVQAPVVAAAPPVVQAPIAQAPVVKPVVVAAAPMPPTRIATAAPTSFVAPVPKTGVLPGFSPLDSLFREKGISCVVVGDERTAVAMRLFAPEMKKMGQPPKGAITVRGSKVVYQSPGGTRFSVYLKGEVPEQLKAKLRAINMENWVFDIKSDPVLAAFVQAHQAEIDAEKDIGRS